MRQTFTNLSLCLALTVTAACAQTKPSFEVATIKPAEPMDTAKIIAAVRAERQDAQSEPPSIPAALNTHTSI